MKPRTKARSVALQALYEIDMANHGIGDVMEARLSEVSLEPRLEKFAYKIVQEVSPIREILDQHIAIHAPEWPIDQVSIIDRNLLRIAIWEFAVSGDTPVKVAINEAVELAKIFGSDSSARFVNGVLGSLANSENELVQALKIKIEKHNSDQQQGY